MPPASPPRPHALRCVLFIRVRANQGPDGLDRAGLTKLFRYPRLQLDISQQHAEVRFSIRTRIFVFRVSDRHWLLLLMSSVVS